MGVGQQKERTEITQNNKLMKKNLLALLLMALFPMAMSADTWKVKNGDGVYVYYEVSTSGSSYYAYVTRSPNGYSGHLDIPSVVYKDDSHYVHAEVCGFKDGALDACTGLTSLSINTHCYYNDNSFPHGLL